MKLAMVLRWTLFGLGGLVGCAIISLAVYLWRNSRPSEAAQQLLAMHSGRATAPDADNAWFYLWGMGAPADVDPLDLGRRRTEYLRTLVEDAATEMTDPGDGQSRAADLRSPSMQALDEACSPGAATPCTLAFDRVVAGADISAAERLQLERYRRLVSYPRWFEVVPFDAEAPLAPFDHASEGQRLEFVELARLAERGEAARVAEGLARDLDFWRGVQRDADTLIPKMLAASALRRHFFFGNRILRRLPRDALAGAIPPGWRREFDADELSMARVLAGEFEYATRRARSRAAQDRLAAADSDDADIEAPDFTDHLVERLGQTINPPQRVLNRIAAVYLQTSREFNAPLHEYSAIAKRLAAENADFRALEMGKYVARVATAEGERRAALLAADLRARGVPHEAVAAAIAASELVDPFKRQPFAWDPLGSTLAFEAPRANGRNRLQIYLY